MRVENYDVQISKVSFDSEYILMEMVDDMIDVKCHKKLIVLFIN